MSRDRSTIEPSCVWTRAHVLDVHWTMCTYNAAVDRFVSGEIQRRGNWEGGMVVMMLRA